MQTNFRNFLFRILIVLSSWAAIPAPASVNQNVFLQFQEAMRPHAVAAEGPWFEGWYYRLSDHRQRLSLAVIGTAAFQNGATIPGYKAILFQHPQENRLLSFEDFPVSQLSMTEAPHDFRWEADSANWLSRTEVRMESRNPENGDRIRIEIRRTSQVPWSQFSWWGPSGWAHLLKSLPLHWYVDNIGGQATYRVELERHGVLEVFTGEAPFHQEKNWGRAFPQSWIWVQGHSADNNSHIALAGGRTTLAGIPLTTYLFGYRSPEVNVDLNLALDPATLFKLKTEPCKGELTFRGQNQFHRVVLIAKAPLDSFNFVSIPTEKGYEKDGGIESFIADVTVEIYLRPLTFFSREKLLIKEVLPLSALEFGADAMKCATSNDGR